MQLRRLAVLSQLYIRRKSVFIAGTALLGAAVFVLDWSFKAAGVKKFLSRFLLFSNL
jgi:hypothetical protein